MNFMMTKVCYQMLVQIQEKARQVPANEFGQRMRDKAALYQDIARRLHEADLFRLQKAAEGAGKAKKEEKEMVDEGQWDLL